MSNGTRFKPSFCVIIAPSMLVLEAARGSSTVFIIQEQTKASRELNA